MIVLVLVIVIFIAVAVATSTRSDSQVATTSTPSSSQSQQYTTTLRVRNSHAVGCKDGMIYLLSSHNSGQAIGSYKQDSDGNWVVYGDEQYEIGRVHNTYIYLTLHGKVMRAPHLHSKAASSPHGLNWCAAEAVDSVKTIIDHDTYDPIGQYDGTPVEASAAFICWANTNSNNKFSDYFCL